MSYPYEGYPAPAASTASGPGSQPPPANSSPQPPYQGNGADPMSGDPAGAPGTAGPESKTTLWYETHPLHQFFANA